MSDLDDAVRDGDTAKTRSLLDSGAEINTREYESGNTPLDASSLSKNIYMCPLQEVVNHSP